MNWLNEETLQPLPIHDTRINDIYIKIPKRENFLYLFHQSYGKVAEVEKRRDFEYAAIYNKQDGLIYEAGLDFQDTFAEADPAPRTGQISKAVNATIRARLKSLVAQARSTLSARQLSKDGCMKLKDYKEYELEDAMRSYFLSGVSSSEVDYESNYAPEWHEDRLLDYLEDKEGYIQREVERVWSETQEDIALQVKKIDLIKWWLKNLESKPDSRLHRQRNILRSLRECPAKTVNVTIFKNEEKFTFRTRVNGLNSPAVYSYSSWNMPTKDREHFERRFGNDGWYYPEEIIDISYRGKSLYSATVYEPLQTKERDSESLKLTM